MISQRQCWEYLSVDTIFGCTPHIPSQKVHPLSISTDSVKWKKYDYREINLRYVFLFYFLQLSHLCNSVLEGTACMIVGVFRLPEQQF